MSNVLDLLLETEEKAREIVETARKREREIQQDAEKKGEAIINEARQEALRLQRESSESTRDKIDLHRKTILGEMEQRQESLISGKQELLDRAADKIVELLISSENDRISSQ